MRDIPLHDIKPLVEVPDDSLFYLIGGSVALVVLVLLLVLAWFYRRYRLNKGIDLRKHYLEQIHTIDTSNAKEAAYAISKYGHLLAQSPREKELLANLDTRLEAFKYKKEVASIDKETLGYFHLFLEVLDAS